MKFDKKMQIVYVQPDYLKLMHDTDSEIFYDEVDEYKLKPHVGILMTENNYKYVVPLTSAKEKHRDWADVTANWYRIYEIVDLRTYAVRKNDILVDIVNQDLLRKIPSGDVSFYKEKILSVLDLRKMFPVHEGVYTMVPMKLNNSSMNINDRNRVALLMKEYFFLCNIKQGIETKCTRIYEKQISRGKVLKYHCDYKQLETVCSSHMQQYKSKENIR